MASLFLLLATPSLVIADSLFSEKELQTLSSDPQWHALLHLRDGLPQIKNSNFLLTSENFSSLEELKKTIDLLKNQPEYRCRFTGRDYFLEQSFDKRWIAEYKDCSGYIEFLSKAPADEISVVFASENLTQPSSIMGHTMMSLEGVNSSGVAVDHAVSFFTDINTDELINFLWGSIVSGKKGYFTNKPFSEIYQQYSISEQRNLWKFYLDFSQKQKTIIHRHLWELKQANISYNFSSHNCATVIQDILATADPKIDSGDLWISPIDVAKSVDRASRIKTKKLYPSSKWKIRFLEEFTDKKNQELVSQWLKNPDKLLPKDQTKQAFFTRELADAVNNFGLETGQISQQEWNKRKAFLSESSTGDKTIDISRYRSPLEVPDDVQLGFGWRKDAEGHWLTARWLPASHRISDNNRQYFSENELKILEFELSINPAKEKLRLDQLQIYSVKALNPYSRFSGGISGQFSFGFQQIYTDDLTSSLGFDLNGGVGLARKFGRDIGSYFMLSAGTNLQFDEQNLYIEPEIGFFVYEVFDMKTNFSFKRKYQSGERVYNSINVNQSIWRGDNSIAFTYDKKFNSTIGNEIFSIELTTFF